MLQRGFVKPEDQEPEIDGFEFYFDAFQELSTSRPSGLDLQAIPFTAIAEYFRIYELEDFDEFVHVMRAMDRVYLEHHAGNRDKGDKKNASGNADKANSNQGGHSGKPGHPRPR